MLKWKRKIILLLKEKIREENTLKKEEKCRIICPFTDKKNDILKWRQLEIIFWALNTVNIFL